MKKFGVLFVAMLVALGLVGATYAYWSDSLTVSGTVSTGEFQVEFTDASSPDSTATCSVTNAQQASMSVSDAYPGYTAQCEFTIENVGSVPAKITGVTASGDDVSNGYLTVTFPTDPTDTTLQPGDTTTVVVQVVATDSVAENSDYSFTVQIDAELP